MSERPRSEKEAELGSAPASLQGEAALDQKVTRANPPGPTLRDGKRAAYSHLQKENADTLGSGVGSCTFSCGKVKQTGLHHRMDSQKRSFGKLAICGVGSNQETDLAQGMHGKRSQRPRAQTAGRPPVGLQKSQSWGLREPARPICPDSEEPRH